MLTLVKIARRILTLLRLLYETRNKQSSSQIKSYLRTKFNEQNFGIHLRLIVMDHAYSKMPKNEKIEVVESQENIEFNFSKRTKTEEKLILGNVFALDLEDVNYLRVNYLRRKKTPTFFSFLSYFLF